MTSLLQRFMGDETGATAIEYSLLAGIIGLGILVGARTLHLAIEARYVSVAADVSAAP
jgi:pilus assembly protein Flp/PilA